MNRSVFVSSFVALSFALAACSSDDASPAAAPAASPVVTTPASSASDTTTPAPVPASTEKPTETPVDVPVVVDAGPPPAAWDPSQIAGLALWLRADKGVPAIATKSGVTGWKDLSGNHNDAVAVPGSGPHKATYGANPSLAFDGTQAMTIKDSASLQWKGDFTVIVIAASAQTAATTGALFGKVGLSSPYAGPALFVNFQAGPDADKGGFGGELYTKAFVTSEQVGLDNGAAHVFCLERTVDGAFVMIDGDASAPIAVSSAVDTSAVGGDAFLGGRDGVNQGFKGQMLEVIAVPSAMSATDYAKVRSYASGRYEIK